MRPFRTLGIASVMLALVACEARQVILVPGLDGALPPGLDPIPPAPEGLLDLRLDPVSASLLDSQSPPATMNFHALGMFEDREEDLSTLVAWRLTDPDLGDLDDGRFTAAGRPGSAEVEALIGSFVARATVTVQVDRVLVAPGLPPSIVARFPEDPTGDTEDGPIFSYPAPDVVIPANMPALAFQWGSFAGAEAYELRFESSAGLLRFYTADAELSPEAEAWIGWTSAHLGRGFSFSVRAVSATGVHRSPRHRIEVSPASILGRAYFWSTKASGILRAELNDPAPVRFFPATAPPPPPDAGFDDAGRPIEVDNSAGCASCHSLSRDGRRMALGFEGEKLLVLDVSSGTPVSLGPPREQRFGFGSFSPDSTRLAFTDQGRLRVMDLASFQITQQVSGQEERALSHPDWSPDGQALVVASSREDEAKNKEVEHETDLARIPVMADGTLGEPEVIVPAAGEDDVLHSPAHSPDGRWVAYVRSDEDSKDNPRSELWLVRSDGRSTPIRLARLNQNVGSTTDATQIGNTMPTWVRGEGGLAWLVFSSGREYGRHLGRNQRDQLWVSAIDLDRATDGVDPSAPAFWVPFQSLDDDAHRAFFVPPSP